VVSSEQVLTNVLPPRERQLLPGQRRRKRMFDILGLPNDVFLIIIKEHLTVFDRAALALVCKAVAQQVVFLPSVLRLHPTNKEQHHEQMTTFFCRTLRSWFPDHLKFCQSCGMYVPKSGMYWRETLERECAGRGGRVARNFFAWTASQNKYHNLAWHYGLWEELGQCRICPRCKLHTSRI